MPVDRDNHRQSAGTCCPQPGQLLGQLWAAPENEAWVPGTGALGRQELAHGLRAPRWREAETAFEERRPVEPRELAAVRELPAEQPACTPTAFDRRDTYAPQQTPVVKMPAWQSAAVLTAKTSERSASRTPFAPHPCAELAALPSCPLRWTAVSTRLPSLVFQARFFRSGGQPAYASLTAILRLPVRFSLLNSNCCRYRYRRSPAHSTAGKPAHSHPAIADRAPLPMPAPAEPASASAKRK